MSKSINVPESVAKRIRSVEDLNDFYAYIEGLAGRDLTFSFPEKEQDRIDAMINSICYTRGVFNPKNVRRILREYLSISALLKLYF